MRFSDWFDVFSKVEGWELMWKIKKTIVTLLKNENYCCELFPHNFSKNRFLDLFTFFICKGNKKNQILIPKKQNKKCTP